jgi:hypothetical protein
MQDAWVSPYFHVVQFPWPSMNSRRNLCNKKLRFWILYTSYYLDPDSRSSIFREFESRFRGSCSFFQYRSFTSSWLPFVLISIPSKHLWIIVKKCHFLTTHVVHQTRIRTANANPDPGEEINADPCGSRILIKPYIWCWTTSSFIIINELKSLQFHDLYRI